MKNINIGLLGMGTIGTGAYEQINKKVGTFLEHTPIPAKITKILDIDPNKQADEAEITSIPEDILLDDSIGLIICLTGTEDFEYDMIKKALKAKKHVVTANKAVIGQHLKELTKLAEDNGVMLRYEASCGGGIPIIKAIEEQTQNNKISKVSGILNGTSNFILTKMFDDKTPFEEALKEAQSIGFAEANPEADLEGDDLARKIAILSSLAYGGEIKQELVKRRGIENITKEDVDYLRKSGYRLKHLAESVNDDGNIYLSVEPVIFKNNHIMANVNNEFNLVGINGNVIGELKFYGKGAGKDATANAIILDVLDVLNAINEERIIASPELEEEIEVKPGSNFKGSYYLRLNLDNSKDIGLSELLNLLEQKVELAKVKTENNQVYLITKEIEAQEMDSLINELGLMEEEYFYSRIEN